MMMLPEPTFSLEDVENAQAVAAAVAATAATAAIHQQLVQQQHMQHLEFLQMQLQKLVLQQERVLKLQEEQLRQHPLDSGGIRRPNPAEQTKDAESEDTTQTADAVVPHANHLMLKVHENKTSGRQAFTTRAATDDELREERQQPELLSATSSAALRPAQLGDSFAATPWAHLTVAESLTQVLVCFLIVVLSTTRGPYHQHRIFPPV
jgi:hypothetical protein